MGFVKMVAMDNLQRKNVEREVVKAVDQESHIITDGHRCYKVLNKIVEKHSPEVVKPKQAMKKLPWVHTTIANSKRRFLGVYHSVNDKYLQNYLNEFTYKLNRSDFARDSFDGLFNVALSGVWNQ
jgi:transposase-like protein